MNTIDYTFIRFFICSCPPIRITDAARQFAHSANCYYQAIEGQMPKCCQMHKVCKGTAEFSQKVLEAKRQQYPVPTPPTLPTLPSFDFLEKLLQGKENSVKNTSQQKSSGL